MHNAASSHQESPMPENFSPDVHGHIAALMIYPVKSLAGMAVQQARLLDTGLEWDRHWMVVDAEGLFLTQRDCAAMALVQPQLTAEALVLQAPGAEPMAIALHAEGPGVVLADCDAARLLQCRSQLPSLQHRVLA